MRYHGFVEEVLLSTADAAKLLGVVPDTVRLWNRSGRLPAMKTQGGIRLFRRDDVKRVAAERAACVARARDAKRGEKSTRKYRSA